MKQKQSKIENVIGRVKTYKDWWKVVAPFNRFYNKRKEHVVTLRNGPQMHIRDVFGYDLPILYEIFGNDVYHLDGLHLPRNAAVLDVGAHIGSFSAKMHHLFPGAHITAFEPHPDNFAFLKKNAPFADCVNKAVAGTPGTVYLGDHVASSSYALGDKGIPVDAVTLDSYIASASRIDLLKVDVEGAEKDIFEHLPLDLLMKVDRIAMEVHPPHDMGWFVSMFESAGFDVMHEDVILFASRKEDYAHFSSAR